VTTMTLVPPVLRSAGGALTVLLLGLTSGCGAPGAEQPGATSTHTAALAWHLGALDADPSRRAGRGLGQTIAFLDTGFDASPLVTFAGRVVSPWNALTQSDTVADLNGHGTAMAVIAAGAGDDDVWGLAPSANVMPIVVADEFGHATGASLASGIRWAVDHHATVINISLASMVPAPEVAQEIRIAIDAGIPVVAAAGDIGAPGSEFPGSEPGVVAVYGQDRTGQVGAHSNLPDGSGVLAPGEAIESLFPQAGDVRKLRVNGTSAAAAVTSGIVAACMSAATLRQEGEGAPDKLCVASLVARSPDRFIDVQHILEKFE
jgi:membrane-anchored mycosin MYCP